MKVKEFDVVIEKGDNGYFVVDVLALPGCHTQGKTKKEALENIVEAIELYLEVSKEKNLEKKSSFVGIEKVKVYA